MRRFALYFLTILLACVLFEGAGSRAWSQSSRTAPLPLKSVARTRLFQKQPKNDPQSPPPSTGNPIPLTPPGQQPATPSNPVEPPDPVLALAKRAIDINRQRYLDPSRGHSPWMIMHGALALRQEYTLKIGNQPVNALEYITQRNPVYVASLEDPLKPPGSPAVKIRDHWFESTAHGGRAHPYVVSFAFEGHVNQFLAILSMADLPLTQTFVVSDSQKPGATKTITMADFVRHAQMNVNAHEEPSWTLWFLTNYLEPDAQWINKDGQAWSMEQLVTIQTNAPLFNKFKPIAPCGGTHGLFALACACNSYQQKHGKLQGAWIAARKKLDDHIGYAQAGQNGDGTFSTEFFMANGYSAEMGKRFKSSGHMLEWLMMALPPERLQEPWIQKAVNRVAFDQIHWGSAALGTADTGAMYHALHALVLYRNRIEPPTSTQPLAQEAKLPPELMKPAPGTATPQPPEVVPVPPQNKTDPPMPAGKEPEATIRLLNPATNKLLPLGNARPLLRPITNSKDTETPPQPGETPEPPPMAEKIGEPTLPPKPMLEKPASTDKPTPAPSEPQPEGAIVKPLTTEEGESAPAPLFGEEPGEMPNKPAAPTTPAAGQPPAEAPAKPVGEQQKPDEKSPTPSLVPPLPEPTPSKSPSTSD